MSYHQEKNEWQLHCLLANTLTHLEERTNVGDNSLCYGYVRLELCLCTCHLVEVINYCSVQDSVRYSSQCSFVSYFGGVSGAHFAAEGALQGDGLQEMNGRVDADARYRAAVFSSDVGPCYGDDPDPKKNLGKAKKSKVFLKTYQKLEIRQMKEFFTLAEQPYGFCVWS